jgi:hypothetical protein
VDPTRDKYALWNYTWDCNVSPIREGPEIYFIMKETEAYSLLWYMQDNEVRKYGDKPQPPRAATSVSPQFLVLSIQRADATLFIRPRLWVPLLQISAQLYSSFISTGRMRAYKSCCWSIYRKLRLKSYSISSFSRHSSPFAHGPWFGDYDRYECGSERVGAAAFCLLRGAFLGVLFCELSLLIDFLPCSIKHAVMGELGLELRSFRYVCC